ncbi:M20/M25/M40 family metallo-hydrolase [uncultured Imperialibacter sp.]|uniref:M28 family metallopeptidase n=1 Tax=uncultured Imperialibacter sp. TaxID=1672639 RepID=UPI0030DB4E95|tara:strand:- start:8322 stop:9620 length:1299 start_codon:yes stop_codon:yes gene_type:complete
MQKTSILPAFFLLFTSLIISCQPAAEINEADVTRIITTLAADDMEGRRMFSPGIEKASKFIQGEFQSIGLEYVDGLNSYEQKFDMYTITPKSMEVTINGQAVAEENLTASVNGERLNITSPNEVEVITVKAGDDFRGAISKARSAEGKVLILADPSHKGIFERYRGFLSGGNHVMALNDKAYVLVLTEITEVSSLNISVENDVKTESLSNVVGKISGKRPNEVVLFSAHYDHLGIRGTEGDTIYNGANDDASGTTAVITLAKYFKDMGTQPERTILFAAFTAEEGGGYGSTYFSQQLNPDEIVAMFNIEMIGKPAVSGPNTAWVTGFDKSSFGELLQKAVKGTEYEFYADPYPDQNLFYRSDNATLARLGVPAHSISTTPIDVDKDYHQASDEVKTLDLAHMTNSIKAIAAAATGMISGEDTPTRVDPANVN